MISLDTIERKEKIIRSYENECESTPGQHVHKLTFKKKQKNNISTQKSDGKSLKLILKCCGHIRIPSADGVK